MTNSKPYYIFEVDFFLLFRPTQNAINSLCINHAKNKRNKITILNVFLSIFDIVKNSKPLFRKVFMLQYFQYLILFYYTLNIFYKLALTFYVDVESVLGYLKLGKEQNFE